MNDAIGCQGQGDVMERNRVIVEISDVGVMGNFSSTHNNIEFGSLALGALGEILTRAWIIFCQDDYIEDVCIISIS